MRGGFRYKITLKRVSKKSSRTRSRSSRGNVKNLAGKTRRLRKKSKLCKYKKYLHKRSRKNKMKKYNQKGGSTNLNYSFLNEQGTMHPRMPAGVYLNTDQGYGANLDNPPIEDYDIIKQCTD